MQALPTLPATAIDPYGSVILQQWNAQRQAAKLLAAAQGASGPQAPQEPVPVSGILPGTAAWVWLTGLDGQHRVIDERGAMGVSTVYACVTLIAGAIASITLDEFERDGQDVLPVESYLWDLLNEQMHPRWSAAMGWEFGTQALLLHGNLYQRIHRVTPYSSRIESFEPLHPFGVEPDLYDDRLVYAVTDPETGVTEVVDQDDMIHVPGPGFDGRRGLSQIRYVLRRQVGTAIAADELAASMMDDGLIPDLALQTEQKLDEPKINAMRNEWAEKYVGPRNRVAPVVLDRGMKIQHINRLSMSSADAQLVENRKLSKDDICEIFGVMPYMIGRAGTQPMGSTAENIGITFVKYTLRRHLVKIAQEVNRKVIRNGRRFFEHDVRSLERGETKSRYENYRIGLGRAGEQAFLTINEVRRDDNHPPVEGGDELGGGGGAPATGGTAGGAAAGKTDATDSTATSSTDEETGHA